MVYNRLVDELRHIHLWSGVDGFDLRTEPMKDTFNPFKEFERHGVRGVNILPLLLYKMEHLTKLLIYSIAPSQVLIFSRKSVISLVINTTPVTNSRTIEMTTHCPRHIVSLHVVSHGRRSLDSTPRLCYIYDSMFTV